MYIGLDFGGTKIAAGLSDRTGKVISKISVKTLKTADGAAIIAQVVEVIRTLQKNAGKKKIEAIGIGIPGQVDAQGRVFNMPNVPGLVGCNIIKEFKKKIKAPIVVENDANVAALAELKYGAGKKLSNFIYITISTGIGGGIILNKKLYSGAHRTAGEVGHMVIVPGGPRCGCGNHGCWESVASGTALAGMAKAKILSGVKTTIAELCGGDVHAINGEMIVTAAKNNDLVAIELLAVNGYYNALGIANLVNCFDPEAIIIGGGLSFNGEYFFEPLQRCLKMFKILNTTGTIKILKAGCKKDTGMLGALALVLP
jgi:glucokinase